MGHLFLASPCFGFLPAFVHPCVPLNLWRWSLDVMVAHVKGLGAAWAGYYYFWASTPVIVALSVCVEMKSFYYITYNQV